MESREISFVTWPDGKVDGGSLSVVGRGHAIEKMIAQFLPSQWFGGSVVGYQAERLFDGMRQNGFRVHTIKIGDDGTPTLDK